jgi:hypothetical protein
MNGALSILPLAGLESVSLLNRRPRVHLNRIDFVVFRQAGALMLHSLHWKEGIITGIAWMASAIARDLVREEVPRMRRKRN